MLGARSLPAGCSDGTKGVIAGGYAGASGVADNVIQYFIIATPGNAVDFGDLTQGRYGLGGTSNETRGVFGGGNPSGSYTGTIDYITIATPGNAIDFGDLTLNRRYVTASANSTRAVFGGGQGTSVVRNNIVDYVTIDTPGNATDFGDLLAATISAGSCSGD